MARRASLRRLAAVLGVLAVGTAIPAEGPAGSRPAPGRDGAVEESRGEPTAALDAEIRALRTRLDRLEKALAAALQALHLSELPQDLEFAGQPVPLDRWDVAERLDRELLLSLGNRGQVVLWLKRSARYFPYIEAELHRAGLPDDLKYVAVIESSLLPTAYSTASALGIWQFIAPTARRYGLAVTAGWDERRHPERSTGAALRYLRDLYAQFRDWPLALAAYNTGETRVEQALRRQSVRTYYQLALSAETERYVFRALAAKLVLADPERYGFQVPQERRYQPRDGDLVDVQVRDRLAVVDLARTYGSFYREIKELNPQIVDDHLARGRYLVRVPRGRVLDVAVAPLRPR